MIKNSWAFFLLVIISVSFTGSTVFSASSFTIQCLAVLCRYCCNIGICQDIDGKMLIKKNKKKQNKNKKSFGLFVLIIPCQNCHIAFLFSFQDVRSKPFGTWSSWCYFFRGHDITTQSSALCLLIHPLLSSCLESQAGHTCIWIFERTSWTLAKN